MKTLKKIIRILVIHTLYSTFHVGFSKNHCLLKKFKNRGLKFQQLFSFPNPNQEAIASSSSGHRRRRRPLPWPLPPLPPPPLLPLTTAPSSYPEGEHLQPIPPQPNPRSRTTMAATTGKTVEEIRREKSGCSAGEAC